MKENIRLRFAKRERIIPNMAHTASDKNPCAEVQAFVDARKKPALFLFLGGDSLSTYHVIRVQRALANNKFDELDIVINSGGGSIDAAYQIAEMLRLHAKKINACVPWVAQSAACLLCISADEIVLDELARLGPLDAQIRQGKKGGYESALNPFKVLEQMQKFALETLSLAYDAAYRDTDLTSDECLKHAVQFVSATASPMFARLNPERLGECIRALNVGMEYADRLLKRFNNKWDANKRQQVLEKLVHGYPSHDYVIDHYELQELGFQISLFSDDEKDMADKLFGAMPQKKPYIECVLPKQKEKAPVDEKK